MTGDLPQHLRSLLRPLLPERAFLRRARGDAAFVTDAPRHTSEPIIPALEKMGFLCTGREGLLEISPGTEMLAAFEEAHPDAPDFLCASLIRFRGQTPCPQALQLFAVGVRLLEQSTLADRRAYDRRVRNLAAVCLRKDLGGIYACAFIDAQLQFNHPS